jgi:hypothetical protein
MFKHRATKFQNVVLPLFPDPLARCQQVSAGLLQPLALQHGRTEATEEAENKESGGIMRPRCHETSHSKKILWQHVF